MNAGSIRWANRSTTGPAWFSTARRTSANSLAQVMAMPPPLGSTNGFASAEPMSRVAALIRSAAPAIVSLTPAAAPPKRSCMPSVRAWMALSASRVPEVTDSLISCPDLPISLPMMSAALIPRTPSSLNVSAVSLPEPMTLARIFETSAISWLEPPTAATEFWMASRVGTTFSASMPKPSNCCWALMNTSLANGLSLANLSSSFI